MPKSAIKSTTVTVRISPEIKQQVYDIYSQKYGITLTDAITIFFHQTIKAGGFPFEMKGEKEDDSSSHNPK